MTQRSLRTKLIAAPGLVLGLLGVLMPFPAAAYEGLSFGVFPYLSLRTLLSNHQPVAKAVTNATGARVDLQSAPDYETFYQRTQAGEYDLVLTAPHFAWLAWKEAGYRPILVYDRLISGVLVVRRGSAIRTLTDLKGKTVTRSDPLAVVAMRLERTLQDAGLVAGRDFRLAQAGSHNNAAFQVFQGKADAAILGSLALPKLPDEVRNGLLVIAETPLLPSQAYLVSQRVSPVMEGRIRRGIEQFMRSQAGRVFLTRGGLDGIHRPSQSELDTVAADAAQVKQILGVEAGPRSTPAGARPVP